MSRFCMPGLGVFLAVILAIILLAPASARATGYAQSQIFTRDVFGYGMYVVRGQASPESLVSAFYMQNIQPDITNWPASEPLWRWTEFDWEFVPGTASTTPTGLIEFDGTLPKPTSINATYYPQDAGSGAPGVVSGYRTDVNWAQGIINLWNSNTANTPITIGKDQNAWDALAAATKTDSSLPNFGWHSGKHPIADNEWPLWGTQPQATTEQLQKAVSINLIRWPYGGESRSYTESDGTVKTSTFVPTISNGSFPPTKASQFRPAAAGLGNQVFVWAKDETNYDPYSNFYDYTIVWTPDKVAYYIGAPDSGLDISKATPLMEMDSTDYPSIAELGPNSANADEEWWGYDWNAGTPMGQVHWSLQLWESAGWGGVPPSTFTEGDMYVKNVGFYPLISGKDGSQKSDFTTDTSKSGVFYQDFSSMTADTWRSEVSDKWWSVAGWSSDMGTDIYHAGLVDWVSASPDGDPALKLSLTTRATEPAVDYYVLGPAGPLDSKNNVIHDPTKYIMAKVEGDGITYASAASFVTDPFWVTGASDSTPVTATVTVKKPLDPSFSGTATIEFYDYPSFKVISATPSDLFQLVGTLQKTNFITPMPVSD